MTDRLLLACAGWTATPNATEFYDALRTEEPTVRQRSIVLAWLQEASDDELWYRPHRGRLQLAATGGRHPGVRHRALPAMPPDQRRDTHADEVLELAGAPRELFARISGPSTR